MKELPSQKYLNECFSYNKKTGILTWKVRPKDHFSSKRAYLIFNSRNALREAGNIEVSKKTSYRRTSVNRSKYFIHRIIWAIVYGESPNYIDHIDGNGMNNALSNLRSVDSRGNNRNKGFRSDNTSGIMGVCWHKKSKQWRAKIIDKHNNQVMFASSSFFEACCIRKSLELKNNYHENHGSVRVGNL